MFELDLTHRFDVAHRLPDRPGIPTKCTSLHGHTWTVTITIAAPTLDTNGMVVEATTFKKAMRDWIDTRLDHATMLSTTDPLASALEHDPTTRLAWFGPGGDYRAHDIPTVEAVTVMLAQRATDWLADTTTRTDVTLARVRVQETPGNTATWTNPATPVPTPAAEQPPHGLTVTLHPPVIHGDTHAVTAIEQALRHLEHANTRTTYAIDDLTQTREDAYAAIKRMEADAALATAAQAPPYIGQWVHYTSYGTPGGEYPSVCRSAVITELDPGDPNRVGLVAINPTGMFFHALTDGGCYRADDRRGGTWHHLHTTSEAL